MMLGAWVFMTSSAKKFLFVSSLNIASRHQSTMTYSLCLPKNYYDSSYETITKKFK